MAVLTNPTANALVTEGLKKAGYSSPSTTLVNRATTYWMEEIKDDIWSLSKGRLISLQSTDIIGITTAGTTADNEGRAVYDNPSDFAHHRTMQLAQGTHYGVCQNSGGSTTTVTLASDEDLTASDAIGKEIILFLTATQTTAFSSYIVNFDTSTKVAKVAPAWTSSASDLSTYSYLVVDEYKRIAIRHNIRLEEMWNYADRGVPHSAFPVGQYTDDEDGLGANNAGQFMLYPVPYFNSDLKLRAIKHNYYVNLKKMDLSEGSGKIYTALLNRWRNVWVQGIKTKALEDIDDARADSELIKYSGMIKLLVSRESYGYDLSNMQQIVNNDGDGSGIGISIL